MKRREMSDVDQLLLNARLRDEMEPYLDESVMLIDTQHMTTSRENEFLASMLAWEKAPVLPISQWFEPELKLPAPESLDDRQLHQQLHQVIGRLFERNIVLEFTEHLSDRQLYCLILRDILPAQEKRISLPSTYLRWQCVDDVAEEEVWLRYYADENQRERWQTDTGLPLPPQSPVPFPRRLPKAEG